MRGAHVGTALNQQLKEHSQLYRAWLFLSSLKPLSFHSCSSGITAMWANHSTLLLTLPASTFSSLTSCRIKSRS